MKFELSEQVLNNLKAFLQRVELKGNESFAFVEIMQCLNTPIKDELEIKQ